MAKENNTLKRAEFNYKFALLTIYARFVKGVNFIITDYIRTAEEQSQRFKESKSLCDGYKKISMHQRGRAMDIVIINDKGDPIWEHTSDYDLIGKFWQGLDKDCVWGYSWYEKGITKFEDIYHFQY